MSGRPDSDHESERAGMVRLLIEHYGLRDERILRAMGRIRRHLYIPEHFRDSGRAYGDHPCSIGSGQTISQPYIVAYMTEKLQVEAGDKILEVGAGSGYQSAVLAELGARVFSIEILPELAEHALSTLRGEGYAGVSVRNGDGYAGWPEEAPFDSIIVTCSPEELPEALVEQLKDGGRMILPVGAIGGQQLVVLSKQGRDVRRQYDLHVRFVPMVRGES
ncbi:MAG: protein-L-isoaspartate O-methyltransferase [Verrucomicrobia bacterium]|nr:protein-L-isoaspartate O-methyltransferase [Verrucomicrobiota bacterium]